MLRLQTKHKHISGYVRRKTMISHFGYQHMVCIRRRICSRPAGYKPFEYSIPARQQPPKIPALSHTRSRREHKSTTTVSFIRPDKRAVTRKLCRCKLSKPFAPHGPERSHDQITALPSVYNIDRMSSQSLIMSLLVATEFAHSRRQQAEHLRFSLFSFLNYVRAI